MSRFVRSSKYRHVFGTPAKREFCYENLKVSSSAWDTNLIKVNPLFISINWNASGGGAFAVIPQSQTGKLPDGLPLFNGHSAPVLDTDFHPFNTHLVASGAEDCKVMIWTIPEDGLTQSISTPKLTLSGHQRKVGHVLFHPTAENVLASSSGDSTIRFWDIGEGKEKLELVGHTEIIQSIAYNWTGDLLATTCKDKIVRVFDIRSKEIAVQAQGHQGAKGSRALWLGDSDKLATTGFSRTSERQILVWDSKQMKEPLTTVNLDMSSGLLMPHFDKETSMLYVAGKGDGNIRYFEFDDNQLYLLSEYKSADPQRGIGFLPKRACRVSDCEIDRVFKVHATMIEPISFTVPRKSDGFQADIFPDCVGDEPSLSAEAFFNGETKKPILISMEKSYVPPTKKDFVAPSSSSSSSSPPSSPGPRSTSSSSSTATSSLEKEKMESLQASLDALKLENENLKMQLKEKDERIKALEEKLASNE